MPGCNLNNYTKIMTGNSPIGLIVIDENGYIKIINQSFLDLLGITHNQAIRKHILELLPNSKLLEVLKTGRVDIADIWSINGKDAMIIHFPITRDGEIVNAACISICLDTPYAKILQHKLHEAESEYKAIYDALIENPYLVYVVVDKNGIITAMNPTYMNALGLDKSEVIGKHILDVTPNSLLPEILKTGRFDEADIFLINGRETIITRRPIIKDGEIVGAIAQSLFMDISGAKVLINKLQETKMELNIYKEEIRRGYHAQWKFDDLIGESPNFLRLKSIAKQLSHNVSNVLIVGESGTGKELFAHAIHNESLRRNHPFVKINCAALPENLLESELFGYEDGAFTGARKGGKHGKFELAMGGTIFLDEIGDMPLVMQTKLLTVLQDRVIERVGGTKPIYVNVRVIAATNRNLEQMVAEKKFRQDLFYRLNVVCLNLPPLRDRKEDIPILANHLLKKINTKLGTDIKNISPKAIELMQNYSWPGNIRELENLLERAINLADMHHENSLTIKHFPYLVENTYYENTKDDDNQATLSESLAQLEKQKIIQALKKTNGNKVQAAKLLGIYPSALYRKLSKYSLEI